MRILGIDPSTHLGLCWLEYGQVQGSRLLHFPKVTGPARLHLIAKGMRSLVEEFKPDIAFIEGYAYANHNTLSLLSEVGGVIKLVLAEAGVPIESVPPPVVKLFATGKGNAGKEAVAEAVKTRWGFTSPSFDVTDACAIAYYGAAQQESLYGNQ